VRNNILIAQEDPQQPWPTPTCHGIGFFDGPVINCIMEKNVISTSAFDGVTLADAQNCQILDNVCFSTITDPKNPDRKPSIKFGAKLKQNKGNTVKDNYAYLFNLKLDPAVVEANNKTVTKEIYEKRLKELEDSINDKFGKFHPVAKFARLGKEKGEYVPPSKPLNGK